MPNPNDELDRLRDRIDSTTDMSTADSEILQAFNRALTLRQSKYSAHRHLKLLRHCTIMAEQVGGLADALEDRAATKDIVAWINRTCDNEETNRDYRVALRVFGRRVTDENGEDPPEPIGWVPSGTTPEGLSLTHNFTESQTAVSDAFDHNLQSENKMRCDSSGDIGGGGALNTGKRDRQNRSMKSYIRRYRDFQSDSSISTATRVVGKRQPHPSLVKSKNARRQRY